MPAPASPALRRDPTAALAPWLTLAATAVALALLLAPPHRRHAAATTPAARNGTSAPVAAHRPTPPLSPDAAAVARVAAAGAPVRAGGGRRRLVALTFDDGPGPDSPAVVAALRRVHAPATFFQVGRNLGLFAGDGRVERRDPRLVFGDHTVDHASLTRLTAPAQAAEVDGTATAMRAAGEPQPTLFRPPYGLYDDALRVALRRRGMAMVLWSVDSEDYERPGVARIVRTVLAGVRPGAIVLLHDGGGDRTQTAAAVGRIVRALRHRGFGVVTVPTLLRLDPPRPG